MEEELNIKFNFIAAPEGDDEQKQKLSLMISTGEHLDLASMLFDANALTLQWIKDDVLYAFDDLVADGSYPLIQSVIDAELYEWLKVDGKTYFKPMPLSPGNRGYVIRKDWLDRLSLDIPTTLDEYYEVIKAFTTNDMNNNRQNDTYGFFVAEYIGSNAFSYIARTFIPCGVWSGDWVEQTDGVHFNGYEITDNGIKAYNTNREEMDKDWNTTDYGLMHPLSWGGFNHDGGYLPIAENEYDFDKALVLQENWMAKETVGGKFDLLKQMNAPYAYMLPLQSTLDEGLLVDQKLKDIEVEGRTKAIVEPAENFDANWDAMLQEWMAAGGAELIERGQAAWEALK